MTTQSRMGSLVESLVNVVIGFAINFGVNLIVLPMFFGHSISMTSNLLMGLIFTAVSVARSYAIRRWFNGRLHALSARLFPAP